MASLSSSFLIAPPSVSSINSTLANPDSSSYSATLLSSNVNPASVNPRALPEPANSIEAVKPFIAGMNMNGGGSGGGSRGGSRRSKIHRKRINNISNMYKMKGSRKTIRRRISKIKSRLRSRFSTKSRKNHKRSNRKRVGMKGGYSGQYLSNVPYTPTYSTGGHLSPSLSALATPAPYHLLPNTAIDNLNHNALNSFGNSGSGMGFPSRGAY
jgi:hypothetical protein